MERDFIYWIRWIAVLPVSVAGGFLIDFPLHWLLYSTLSGGENPIVTPYPRLPELLLAPFFRAFFFIWASSKIAPEQKLITAYILGAIWIFAAGGAFALGFIGYQKDYFQLALVANGFPVFFGILGVFLSLVVVNKNLAKKEM